MVSHVGRFSTSVQAVAVVRFTVKRVLLSSEFVG